MPAGDPSRDPKSLVAAMAYWGLTLGMEFTLPSLLGLYLDRRFGTLPLGTVTGAILGFLVGMLHILRFARESSRT